MRGHHMRYALLFIAATTVRVIYRRAPHCVAVSAFVRDPKKCYEKVNDDRATYKEGVRAAYKCAEGPPGGKWNLAGDLPPTTIRRRANAKELRRAYDRAREELRTLEREARPKDIK